MVIWLKTIFNAHISTSTVTNNDLEGLNRLLVQYPYLQSARALLLKGLKNKGSFKYNHELKTTAAHTTDRSMLFEFITSDAFSKTNDISVKAEKSSDNSSVAIKEIQHSVSKEYCI